MAKKDKPTKAKSKAAAVGGAKSGGAITKKKSDKVAANASGSGEKPVQQPADPQIGAAGNETNAAGTKAGSISSNDAHPAGGEISTVRSSKVAGPPEWDSETVRKAALVMDGFSCCTVLVMEDSPELTKFGEFLLRAIETGVRRKFHCISGAQTAERVKRFLNSYGHAEDDQSYMERQDLFAEAIKHTLLRIKDTVATEIDADHQTKEMELAGARSKDLIRYVPPLTISMQGIGGVGSQGGVGEGDGIREPPPAPPPTEQSQQSPSLPAPKRLTKTKNAIDESESKIYPVVGPTPSTKIGVKTRMRKRGEVPMPEFEVIDDSPPKGPRSYVLLQGFYNPGLIEELRKIGVKVDGILLMTDAKVNRYNFSIIDVEDSIPGTFRPKNALPQYLKALERLAQNPATRNSEVAQFWTKLSEMYNTAPTDSPFHDIALMNFPLPDSKRINLESSDGITYYISKVYDELAKRVYEMLVLEEWFQEFTSAVDATKLQPLEPILPHDIYDQIVGQIPAECISVPIILEAVVQQVAHSLDKELGNPVPEPCYEENSTAGIITGKSSFGSTNWGSVAHKNNDTRNDYHRQSAFGSSLLKIPMYIKAGDHASIRSCHLNESLASKIASCQLSGDMRNIRGFLWQKVPEFNRGLYMKLLGNLNHFMYFMPPDMIQFEDMFYVLHLLMSAGVEVHLQKAAETRKARTSIELTKPNSILNKDGIYRHNRPEVAFPGTNLTMENNYLAVSKKTGLNFVISPNSNHELTVSSFGHSQAKPDSTEEKNAQTKTVLESFLKDAQQQPLPSESEEPSEMTLSKKAKRKKSRSHKHKELDVNKAARVTTVGAIQTAAKVAQTQNEARDKAESEILEKRKGKGKGKNKKGKSKEDESTPDDTEKQGNLKETAAAEATESQQLAVAEGEGGQGHNAVVFEESRDTMVTDASSKNLVGDLGVDEPEKKTGFGSMNYPSKDTKRFIACEEQWFEDINDTSVIQALLECPALLAINESGALDLTKWIEKYLLSAGMDVGPGEGVLLGDLKNWNYVEELVPIQTVQMLNEASQEYLSMQRMYCPFYDTLLFIFNNPMPQELTAETQFYFRLKTLPGLQHFLEYTMDDQNVLRWIEQLDSGKRLEAGEQTSINTLLSIIPEEQWLMVPSIKYQIMVDNQRSLSTAMSSGSLPTNKNTYYGKIGSYSKPRQSFPPPSPDQSGGSTKSFVPSITGGGLKTSPSGAALDGSEIEVADQITTAQDTVPSVASGENVKSGAASSKALSVKSGKTAKTEAKSDTQTNKVEKKSITGSRLSKDENGSSPDQGAATDTGTIDYFSLLEDKDNIRIPKETELIKSALNFTCYDLGKRVAVVGNDTFFLFPMDGTVIRYDISTIEPEFRMMQLTVTKNGHETFFYPYYIPHDFDLSMEDYVVCPYFHMVLSNGTIFAFQDLRAEEAAPYIKIGLNKKHQQQDQEQLFSFEKVLFGKEVEKKLHEVASAAEKADAAERLSSAGSAKGSEGQRKGSKESVQSGKKRAGSTGSIEKVENASLQVDDAHSAGKIKSKKGLKEKKSKKLHDKSPDEKKEKKEKKGGKKDKKNKGNKTETETEQEEENEMGGASLGNLPMSPAGTEEDPEEMEDVLKGDGETTADELGPAPPPTSEADDGVPGTAGEWMYPSSENSDEEAETQKRRLFFAPPWDDAVQLIQPMTHSFTATLPSGLMATVEDLPGPPLSRIVKQHYVGHGSAKSSIEGSRYYTMEGSVIKFLLNGSIQILTARGVTTTIDELAANAKRETENVSSAFGTASVVKIFNGEVILPNGQLWQVVNGKKVSQTPIYVFTTGPLTGGEVFRRRQDGVVYLHRYDGTVITHYPDGTRFTTRMVILEKNTPSPTVPPADDAEAPPTPPASPRKSGSPPKEPVVEEPDDEFSDWVFVGLKYMIEHPNYSTVLFNTLSGNVHLKLPHGEWVRVFADGNVRISTEDQYSMDVDKDRALLSFPPCSKGKGALPNLTAVRLWHAAPPGQSPPDGQAETQTTQQKDVPQATGESAVEDLQQVHLDLPAGFEEKEVDNLAAGKKKSKNIHHAKSLHPKVKQREGTKTKGRATRQGSLVLKRGSIGEGKKDPSAADAEGKDAPKVESRKNSGEESKAPSDQGFTPFSPPPPNAKAIKPSLRKSGDKLTEFLTFEDETTFCKAIDSWDNRFLMDVYGGAFVDKLELDSVNKEMGTQHLIETLSEHSQLPKGFISGILKNTSSENLQTAARRLQTLRKGYNDSCSGNLPNTKVFVVKRDLTAFQFLQKSQVEDVVTKAYSSRESMVIVDKIPKRHPRKFVTIMRPVEEAEEPHGMWTRQYIEPMFRPRGVTNKHLRVATPNDLRWFGYVLNAAHAKRPKFVPEPKEAYKEKKYSQMRAEMTGSSDSPQEEPGRQKTKSLDKARAVQSADKIPVGDDVGESKGASEEEGYSGEGEEEEEMSGDDQKTGQKGGGSIDDDKKKKKKDKKEKEKEKDAGKKAKGKDKKGKGMKESTLFTSDEEAEEMVEDELNEEDALIEIDPISGLAVRQTKSNLHNLEPDIEEYPNDIEDVKGIYEMERERRSSNLPKIIAKEHSIPCNTKKAIVVRSFVEIPQVDESMQRALLAASMSYADTCKTETTIFKTYKTEDPRTPEEKQKQTTYKQQMIEQNIDEMHLLEQKPGPVLRFHF